MMFLVRLVDLSAAACISEEINSDLCWCKNILRIQGRVGFLTSQNLFRPQTGQNFGHTVRLQTAHLIIFALDLYGLS